MFLLSRVRQVRKADKLTTICEPIVISETSMACYGIALYLWYKENL
jgi:hypothetical protein